MNLSSLIQHIEVLPLANRCFQEYLRWLTDQGIETDGENPLLSLPDDVEGVERLQALEKLLHNARILLSLPVGEFVNVMGFKTDLLTGDKEKIHDILAELQVVVALDKLGFQNLKKLRRFVKRQSERLPCADLMAVHDDARYCIEVKTIRIESKPKPVSGKLMGDPLVANWWGQMFTNNLTTKIEDKNRRLIKQLNVARESFDCDHTVLAVCNRRLGPSTLMSDRGCERELDHVRSKYQEIDYFLILNYFGQVVFYPRLPT